MKTKLLFLAGAFLLLACSNEKENELFGEMDDTEVKTKAGYRGVGATLYLTNSLQTPTRFNWEFISIDFIGGDNIISSIKEDFVHTDFSGSANVPAGNMLEREIIDSNYLLPLQSVGVDRIDLNFYSLYAGTGVNIDKEALFDIRVDIKSSSYTHVLATRNYRTSSSKDRMFIISLGMSGYGNLADYYIEIYIEVINEVSILTDIEGNTYTYRKFGNAGYWMTQNLCSTKNNIIDLRETSFNYTSSADSNHPEYGFYYSWKAATAGQNSNSGNQGGEYHSQYQGICPEGWHLPSDIEWSQLEQAIIASPSEYSTTTSVQRWENSWATAMATGRGTHGKAMKSITMINGYETDGTSLSSIAGAGGFNAFLTGNWYLGSLLNYGRVGFFWTSSSERADGAFYRHVHLGSSNVYRSSKSRSEMLNVRCKKND